MKPITVLLTASVLLAGSLAVEAANQPPTISSIPSQTTSEDTPTPAIPFTVGDAETPATNLVVTGTSSNPTLLPPTNIVFGGTASNRTVTLSPAANQFGTATIGITVHDAAGATATTRFILTVIPVNDPPTLDPIANLSFCGCVGTRTVNLTGITSGATNEIQTLVVTAVSSNPGLVPDPTVIYVSPLTTGSLALTPANGDGSAIITVTVNDGQPSNNIISRSFTVTLTSDTTPPVFLSCPTNPFVVWTCSTNPVQVFFPSPRAVDDCVREPIVDCVPSPGSLFPIGDTVVTCTARDNCTNLGTCSFTVRVIRDTTPPRLACPTNITVWTCDTNAVQVFFDPPTATDDCDTNVVATCTHTNGSFFPIGVTTVRCSARDACGNAANCSFTVTVKRDTTPPAIHCPTNLTVLTCASNGERVFFNVTATDDCDPNVMPVCVPASGSVFPLGATAVICSAADACGNVSRCELVVSVLRDTNRCVTVASRSGGDTHPAYGGVDVTAAALAELIRNDEPVPFGGHDPDLAGASLGPGVQADAPANSVGDLASLAPALPQTPAATTSWIALGPGGGFPSDAQIGVSHTHVIVSGRAWMGFYDKAGTQLATLSARSFYKPLGLDDGTVNAITSYNDIRIIYDSYRQRFWVGATGNRGGQTDKTKARTVFTVGISKTEDPTAGWYLYWWDAVAHFGVANDVIYKAGDTADYPVLGIDPLDFHQTIGVNRLNGGGYEHAVFFPADVLASGAPGPISGWQFWDLTNPDGSPLSGVMQAVVHHGATGRAYYVSRNGSDQLVVWALTDPLTPAQAMDRVALTMPTAWNGPVDAPQKGSAKLVKMTNLGTWPIKAVYRGGFLHLVSNDAADWFGDGQMLSSVRLNRLFVLGFPNVPTIGDPNFVNRTFGMNSSIDDPPNAHVYYAWSAVEVNKNLDMALVYARSGTNLYPEVRISAYYAAESDIRPSRLLKAGEAPADIAACDNMGNVIGQGSINPVFWGDTAGASVDPKDDTSIWVAQEYARSAPSCNGNRQIWVGKVFGAQYVDWGIAHFQVVAGNLAPGSVIGVAGTVVNQGDGTASSNRVAIYIVQPAAAALLLATLDQPPLRPGEPWNFRVSAMVPAGISPCQSLLKVVVDPDGSTDEYSKSNNIALADVPSRLHITALQPRGPYRIRVFGKEQCNYTLQASADLVRWGDLTTQSIVNGSYDYLDDNSTFTHRFYRTVKAP